MERFHKHMTTPSSSAILREDFVTVPGQRFALISMVGPQANQKTEQWGLKFRGCFNTKEEANAHVKDIMASDPHFDVYLVDMYKWILFPPDKTKIDDVHYQEQYLNDLMRGYAENQKAARKFFEERQMDVMKDGLDKHLLPEERIQPEGASSSVSATDLMQAMQETQPSPP